MNTTVEEIREGVDEKAEAFQRLFTLLIELKGNKWVTEEQLNQIKAILEVPIQVYEQPEI